MNTARVSDDRQALWFASKRLVRRVRQHLGDYGIRPIEPAWSLAWDWAHKIARSYLLREVWPSAHEIASQYLLLLLTRMKDRRDLRLPYRAKSYMTPAVVAALGGAAAAPALPMPEEPQLTEEAS